MATETQRGGAATNLPPRAISDQLSAVSWWCSALRASCLCGILTGTVFAVKEVE